MKSSLTVAIVGGGGRLRRYLRFVDADVDAEISDSSQLRWCFHAGISRVVDFLFPVAAALILSGAALEMPVSSELIDGEPC